MATKDPEPYKSVCKIDILGGPETDFFITLTPKDFESQQFHISYLDLMEEIPNFRSRLPLDFDVSVILDEFFSMRMSGGGVLIKQMLETEESDQKIEFPLENFKGEKLLVIGSKDFSNSISVTISTNF
ncbi:MAG: hypothetical protein PHP08_02030 [Candidatus Dojkabacteria bacterium]|nr:hypothetical protein [Candidatus Dojkabacteria bacterium]